MRTTTLKSHLLAVLMLLTGISAFAYDFEYEGLYYNILSEEDKTVEVTYQKCLIGPTYSYCNPAAIGNVEIPSKVLFKSKTYHVIAIGIYAFRNDEGYGNRLTSVTIPNSVTSIDHMAFKGCSDLIDIHVDSDNQYYSSIDGILFNKDVTILIKCPEKKELVVIPNSVTSIGYMAFYYCRGLTSLTIGNSVTSIGDEAFYGCNRLTSLTIGNSASIGREAFCGCSRLASVTIGNSETIGNSMASIGYMAFCGCTGLTSVTIGNSVTSIGNYAFSGCTGLTSVTIGNSASIGNRAFFGCRGLTSVTIGNSETIGNFTASIGDEAFCDCKSLTSVTIGNSVTSIGDRAFSGCSGLTSLTIGNSVTSIGDYAFYYCRGLTSLTIGNSTSIGNYAFCGCSRLASVTIGNSETIGNSMASIGREAFSGCESLTSVTIPNSVTSIGREAFSGCKSLTSVTIPNSVTSIGDWAFSGCSGLTSLTIGNSVTSIGNYAFSNCHRLTSLTIPSSVIAIGSFAFASSFFSSIYCQALTPPLNSIYGTATDPIFNGSTYEYAKLYVPIGCRYAYKKAFLWKSFWNIEEMDFSGINEVAAEDIGIFVQDGVVHIDNADENTLVEVFDISGKNVYRGYDNVVSGLAKGIYVVRICGNSTKIAL